MNRPKGVIAISIYYVVLAVVMCSRLDMIGLIMGSIYGYLAYRLWMLKYDGRRGTIVLAWFQLITLSAIILAIGIPMIAHRAYPSPKQLGIEILLIGIIFSIPILIIRYLSKPEIVALFPKPSK